MQLAIVVILGFLATVAFMATRVSVTLLALQSGASAFEVGALFAGFSLLQVTLGVWGGRWVDRAGLRLPGLVGGLLTLAGLAAVMISPGMASLAFCAAAAGSMMLYSVTGLAAVAGQLGDSTRRTANIAWFMFGNSAGLAVGPVLAGFGFDLLGTRAVFGLIALFPAGIVLILWRSGGQFRHTARAPTAGRTGMLQLALSPGVRPALIVSLFGPLIYEMFTYVVPVLGSAAGLSASQIGIVLGSSSAVSLLTRATLPRLARRLKEWTVAWATYLVGGSAFFMLAWSESMLPMLAIAMVIGVTHGVGNPILMSLYHASLPRERQAEMFGLRGVLGSSVLGCAPALVGALSAALGMTPVLGLVAAGTYALSGYAWRKAPTREPA